MKIVVLNGSPKGDLSITLQSVNFIKKKFPEYTFTILNIAEEIKNIEKDNKLFQDIINEIRLADVILWIFPVYVFLVPYQYKRFIELIRERGREDVFKNKYTAAFSTSIHFCDHIAHNYMNAICDDLDMKYFDSFSAEMHDFLKSEERDRLLLFARSFFSTKEKQVHRPKNYRSIIHKEFDYIPSNGGKKINTNGKKIIVLTDCGDGQDNLLKMINKFKNYFSQNVEIVNLNKINIKGGCLGCLQCGLDNICVYQNTDEFTNFYSTKLLTADIIVFAGAIKDRYLSSRWKLFFDRGFFNTHIPTLRDKQIGFIISGPLRQVPDLVQILKAYSEFQQANFVDIITDEYTNSAKIDMLLYDFSRRISDLANINYYRPPTFLSVAAMKIFRDYIWGKLRFILQGDHKFYSKNNFYDFPQKDIRSRISNALIIPLTKIPFVRKKFAKKIKKEMVKKHKRVLETI